MTMAMDEKNVEKQSPLCFLRVDASATIGTGHVMRCLALADELKSLGCLTVFVIATAPEPLIARLREAGHEVTLLGADVELGSRQDASAFIEEINGRNGPQFAPGAGCFAIVDGYHFLADYQETLKSTGLPFLYIDDKHHCASYCADLILNQNPSASPDLYSGLAANSKLYLGLPYTLLRSEFTAYKKANEPGKIGDRVDSIIVTMGGADVDNVTGRVLESLASLAARTQNFDHIPKEIIAIAGGGNSHREKLQALCDHLNAADGDRHERGVFRCVYNVSAMPALLGRADLVVTAGGTTVWEAAYLGRPTAVIITADNQEEGMNHFAIAGAVELLGSQQDLPVAALASKLEKIISNQVLREQIATTAATTIDGQGAARMAIALLGLTGRSTPKIAI